MSFRDCSGAGSVALSVCRCFQPLVLLCYLLPPLHFFSLLSTPFCVLLANDSFLSSFLTSLPSVLAYCSLSLLYLAFLYPSAVSFSLLSFILNLFLLLSELSYFYQSYFSFMFSLYSVLSLPTAIFCLAHSPCISARSLSSSNTISTFSRVSPLCGAHHPCVFHSLFLYVSLMDRLTHKNVFSCPYHTQLLHCTSFTCKNAHVTYFT